MVALLQCGHTALDVTFGELTGKCPHCKSLVVIKALECREWVMTCATGSYCRQRRYGADRDAAEHARQMHSYAFDHRSTIDFLVPKQVKTAFKKVYPRTVRPYIPVGMLEDKNPRFVTSLSSSEPLPEEPPF